MTDIGAELKMSVNFTPTIIENNRLKIALSNNTVTADDKSTATIVSCLINRFLIIVLFG